MSHLLQLSAPLAATLAAAAVAATWQGALLALLTLAALRLVPALSAAARSFVWLAALLLLVGLNLAPLLATHHAGNVAPPPLLRADPRWSLALAALWMTLTVLRALQLLHSFVALHRLARRARPLPLQPASLLQLGRATTVQLCASADVNRPSVVGFFAPKILLPDHLATRLSLAELTPILCHEMEHLRRRDDWTNLLQKLALALFPLSPALFWVERRLCGERELACDDGVLRATGARKAYATCLASLAERSLLGRGLTLALGAWDRRSELELRIRRILRPPTGRMSASQTATTVAALLLVTTAASLLTTHAPQLVAFQRPNAQIATAQRAPALADAPFASPPGVEAAHVKPASGLARRRCGRNALPPMRRVVVAAPHRSRVRVMLAGWRRADVQPPRRRAAEPEIFFPCAAVRIPGGWLVFQL